MHDDCTEYEDLGLVFAQATGRPYTDTMINNRFHQLIAQTNLLSVVFHSLRHSSITFKLKLTGGNIKCVQGDSGHSQSTMVTDLYTRILVLQTESNALSGLMRSFIVQTFSMLLQ